jgi:hypothetical protein
MGQRGSRRHHRRRGACAAANTLFHAQRAFMSLLPRTLPDGAGVPARARSASSHPSSEFWHQNAINGKQYGFPHDDYAGQSSDISVANPQYAVVAVGW